MKLSYLYILFLVSCYVFSQNIIHKVEPKETVYGITHRYGITEDELIKANPFLQERSLQIGDELVISKGETTPTAQQNYNPGDDDYIYVTIEPKETIYNLTKTYNISEETLRSLNPSLSEGLKIGDIIRIPKSKETNPKGMHLVQPKETVYSISREYNLKPEDIYAVNKDIQNGVIKIGSYIKIPTKSTVKKVEEGNFIHQVKAGETIFSLINKYDTTLENLLVANPKLSDGLKAGMELKIPVQENAIASLKNGTPKNDGTKKNIILFLPLDASSQESSAYRKASVEFFLGAKLALDSLSTASQKISLRLIDSEGKEFQNFLNSTNFADTDLILGPLKSDNILEIAKRTQDYNVPIVSPFSNSEELRKYSNIIICEPLIEYMGTKIAEESLEVYNDQKVFIYYWNEEEKKLAESISKQILEKQPKASIYITRDASSIVPPKDIVTEQYGEVISILVSSNEDAAKTYLDEIGKYDASAFRLFSTYYNTIYDDAKYKPFLEKSNFTYTIERKINQNGQNEKNTLYKFKDRYCKLPSKYSVIGFDVTYDFITRMQDEKGSLDMKSITTQLASRFDFIKKESSGAYLNKGFRLVRMRE
ncbi:MAG: LysM peptidoglycan-binding domain-containing protein [Flavobacteriales bacterium]|nr:LysM peptidoglycan-binding domain-containing protein [Flavobacteriales bacterium]